MDNPTINTPRDPVPDWAKPENSSAGAVANQIRSGKPKITPKQREYLLSLIERKAVKPEHEGNVDLVMKCLRISEDPEEYGMSMPYASQLIDWFKALDDKPDYQPKAHWGAFPNVPAGRYAVESNEGELRFYTVWRPKDNPSIFRLYVQHGPDSSQVHFNAQLAIMEKIAADVRAAAIRYGMEIGACSNCGRRLTNRISRELGIGPVCGGRMFGDEWKDEVRTKREEIMLRGEDPDEELE